MNRKNLNDLKKIFLIQIYNFKTIVKKAGIIQKRFVSHIYFAFISKFFFLRSASENKFSIQLSDLTTKTINF